MARVAGAEGALIVSRFFFFFFYFYTPFASSNVLKWVTNSTGVRSCGSVCLLRAAQPCINGKTTERRFLLRAQE